MLPRMIDAAGVTEKLKVRDPMRWVGVINALKAQVEEVLFTRIDFPIVKRASEKSPGAHFIFSVPSFDILLVLVLCFLETIWQDDWM